MTMNVVFMSEETEANPRAIIGGNAPPTPIDDARDVYRSVAHFLADMPTIQDASAASRANEHLAAAKGMLIVLGITRDAECDPLYSEWKTAREKWAPSIKSISDVKDEISLRLGAFMRIEEAKRKVEAAEAKRIAEAAEQAARDAEQAEAEARENASVGEFVDVVAASETADAAFDEFQSAARNAKQAEKHSTVVLKSRFGAKATKLRTIKTLVITDFDALILAVGVTADVTAALLSAARAYRKAIGTWPPGVTEETERGL